MDGSSGGAVTMACDLRGLERGLHHPFDHSIVACLAAPLHSSSNESVAFSLAVPLTYVLDALVDEPALSRQLLEKELAMLSSARPVEPRPGITPPAVLQRFAVRRSVALLWLESTGSWASGVIISSVGHVLTCAHFLTGHSWVEAPTEASNGSTDKGSTQLPKKLTHTRGMPKRCHGRVVQELLPDGQLTDITFEADVLHIFDGCLDVALLLIRPPASPRAPVSFTPVSWP